ncbi:GNAT family N-acetyltransferase [Streptomyces parvulus]|nr:GNAT family N-acetyltransferase [Streptomyces parvulus]
MSPISSFSLRPLRREDVTVAADQLMLASATGVRHHLELQLAAASAGERGSGFVAERDGVVIGAALLSTEPTMPGAVVTLVAVSRQARGHGVGRALADLLDEQLADETLPASCILRDDLTEGRGFAERRGFTLSGHSVGWSIDLSAQDSKLEAAAHEAAQTAGVRVRQAELTREVSGVLECAARCMPGMPGAQGRDAEQGRDYFPGDAVVLLAERDNPSSGEAGRLPLGMTAIAPRVEENSWYTLFTGVDPSLRRGGIGRALKTESFQRARRAGARSVLTHNHDTNAAIIGLNTAFDMRRAPGYWDLRRTTSK